MNEMKQSCYSLRVACVARLPKQLPSSSECDLRWYLCWICQRKLAAIPIWEDQRRSHSASFTKESWIALGNLNYADVAGANT